MESKLQNQIIKGKKQINQQVKIAAISFSCSVSENTKTTK